MNRKSKIIFKEWIFIVTGWIFIMYLYNLVTIWGMRHMLHDNALTVYFDSGYPHLEIFLQGTVFGTLFAFINTLTDRTEIRKKIIRCGNINPQWIIPSCLVCCWSSYLRRVFWIRTGNDRTRGGITIISYANICDIMDFSIRAFYHFYEFRTTGKQKVWTGKLAETYAGKIS
jgi:hypothetical protein